jgi:hypothetical protein
MSCTPRHGSALNEAANEVDVGGNWYVWENLSPKFISSIGSASKLRPDRFDEPKQWRPLSIQKVVRETSSPQSIGSHQLGSGRQSLCPVVPDESSRLDTVFLMRDHDADSREKNRGGDRQPHQHTRRCGGGGWSHRIKELSVVQIHHDQLRRRAFVVWIRVDSRENLVARADRVRLVTPFTPLQNCRDQVPSGIAENLSH